MKKFLIGFFLLVLVGIFSVYFFIQINSRPVNSDPSLQSFVINQGDGISSISIRLQKNNLVRNDLVFMFLSYQMGLNSKLQAGIFKLSPSMSTSEIIQKLSKGGNNDYWLKIIEGQRIEEISLIKFDKSLEGYLFPDSYLIPIDYAPNQIVELIKANFDKKIVEAKTGSTITDFSDSQLINLASLIEREARTLTSKKMVAGILLNRLRQGMALQVDATVQYARDSRLPRPKDYWQPISKADLRINSPYNTYLNPGLPPTSICNPGLDSLFAVFHPTTSDYLFYITGNDNQMHYAKTLDEHNLNIAKYLN
jgi:UPF0755 protein